MVQRQPASGLLGRRNECEILDQLLREVRASRSSATVLRGEAGIGKTALINYLTTESVGCRVLRITGAESESEFAFAGLHQLCAPVLDHVERLPTPQRDALETAFGRVAGDPANRFLVGIALLTLLAGVAEQQPLLCLVDDAHWVDRESRQILAFVVRRLLAEPIGFVFAVRDPSDVPELDALPQQPIRGLGSDDARTLLALAILGHVDERVREQIVSETRGNPLALLELPRRLAPSELAGGFGLSAVRPLESELEMRFLRTMQTLPSDARRLLVLAAAEPLGDATLLQRAADTLGVTLDAAAPAVAQGLVEFGSRVRFCHPLVRSAAYRSGSVHERRHAHHALAHATDARTDPDRRAWHRAHSVVEPDEDVANELELSAARARMRGGVAAAAAFLKRATELTLDPFRRAERALAAAQCQLEAAEFDEADALLTAAEFGQLDELQKARVLRLRAQIVFARRRGSDAPPLLLDAAKHLQRLDTQLARDTFLEALGAASFAGRLSREIDERAVATAARESSATVPADSLNSILLDGLVSRFIDGYAASVPALTRALGAVRRDAVSGEDPALRWLWLACPVAPEPLAVELWDDDSWADLATRAVGSARGVGALTVLPVALSYLAAVHVHAGQLETARGLIDEADAITIATGHPPMRYTSLLIDAWRGDEARAVESIDDALKEATDRGEGRAIGLVGYVKAILYNGLGRYSEALAGAQLACEHDDLGFYGLSLTEMVEAATRSDLRSVAEDALRQLEERTLAVDTDWAHGVLAKSRALLSVDAQAEAHFREALERLTRTRVAVHRARTHLTFGEWLRRENRRTEAREHLNEAHEMFHEIGAEAFAERARRELLATGETVRRRSLGARATLTPQETQIAQLATEGQTNTEIGTALFISPRTVEYHLSKVFTKLQVDTRRALGRALTSSTR